MASQLVPKKALVWADRAGDLFRQFGASQKDTMIYELEFFAGVLSLQFWSETTNANLQVWDDAVRFSLIKGSAEGEVGRALMEHHQHHESTFSSQAWFARMPTEANISDCPSRGAEHPLLEAAKCKSLEARALFDHVFWVFQNEESGLEKGELTQRKNERACFLCKLSWDQTNEWQTGFYSFENFKFAICWNFAVFVTLTSMSGVYLYHAFADWKRQTKSISCIVPTLRLVGSNVCSFQAQAWM